MIIGAAMTDVHFHRGVETGAELPTVVQASGRELATNADLTIFPREQLESVAATLQAQGFRYVRQPVAWSAIETGQGRYVWDGYDVIVEALTNHGLAPVLVLYASPDWSRPNDAAEYPDGPPIDVATYAAFVRDVVTRYRDRVEFVQIWDMPNRSDRWGGRSPSASEYFSLVAAEFNAARTASPETKVLLGELDPMPPGESFGADLRFLRQIYDLPGSSAFFDIVTVQLDGGEHSPDDRSVNSRTENFSRAILFRQLMIDEDDASKTLWATRYGWNAGESGAWTGREEQADFLVAGLRRARAEWPWMGPMFAWDLMPSAGAAGYSLLTESGQATPALGALQEYAASGAFGIAGTGFVPMDSVPVTYDGNWRDQHLTRRTFRFTQEVGATATLTFRGTGVVAILRESPQAGLIHASIDDEPLEGRSGTATASEIDLYWDQASDVPVVLATGLKDGVHQLEITLTEPGQLTVGGLIVTREVPFMWPVVTLAGAGVLLMVFALRELAYVTALRAGYLQRREGIELRPPLPIMPDWRPMRRV